MNRLTFMGIFCFLVIGIMTCTVCGEKTQEYLITISGNSSVISTGTDDDYLISVDDVDPNASISYPNRNTTPVPLEKALASETYNAALILYKSSGEKETSLVKIVTPIYFPENKTFTSDLIPIQFYEGTLLSEYEEQGELTQGGYVLSQIILESSVQLADNDDLEDCFANPALCFDLPDSDVEIKPGTPIGGSCNPAYMDCTPYK